MDTAAQMTEQSPTASALLVDATAALAAAGVPSARLDAEVLLATASGIDRTALYARANLPGTTEAQQMFRGLLTRRLRREPLQYIVGRQEFWSLDLVVTPDVLIPRPESELLVELALALTRSRESSDDHIASPRSRRGEPRVRPVLMASQSVRGRSQGSPLHTSRDFERRITLCDLGTGSGCLAVALARELPHADVWAVDRSIAALAAARENARCHDVERIRFVAGDLFAPIGDACFDMIVCNPPYIASNALAQLQPELAWEPRGALDGGADGLDVIRRVVAAAPAHLISGGWLIMEIGADQGPAALDLAHAARFAHVSVRDDYAGRPRVLLARR
jgi:release factor glutamine methyltransferase